MNILITGIVVGICAGAWIGTSTYFGLVSVAGFFAWASYFAVGGTPKAFKTSMIPNISGALWGALMIVLSNFLSPYLGSLPALVTAVTICAAGICWQSKLSVLGFIPGTFIGCSTYFSSGPSLKGAIIGLVIGAFIGLISEESINYLVKLTSKKVPEEAKA